jgi:glycosyltransferase involved in cell wall biosynthesis
MIEAMPTILASIPDAVYVVMGATHPHLLALGRDAYRESLIALAGALRIAEHVVFLNRFFDQASMLAHISMCDVYVTPYLEEAQMTSGALALSHGIGRPVVSTPYWHAAELLADGSGRLVPFGDRAALAHCVANLLQDDAARTVLARRAYGASRPTTWANIARRYTHTFQRVCTEAGSARFRRSG